ncbi:MAG: hypothetical protein ACREQL_01080 [Candidatus Binatia bacterium]
MVVAVLLMVGQSAGAAVHARRSSRIVAHRVHSLRGIDDPRLHGVSGGGRPDARDTDTRAGVSGPDVRRPVIPGTPSDNQAPAANDLRPSFLVVWLGSKHTPPAEMPMQSGVVTLYAADLGTLARRVLDSLAD